jgi:hypothetical protein
MTAARIRWLLIAALLVVAGVLAARGALWYQTGDFFCLYSGGRSIDLGHDPYDAEWWKSATGGLYLDPRRGDVTSSCAARFAYPLWTAVALAPFGWLPVELAASLWMALSISAAIFGASWLWRAYDGRRRYAGVFAAIVFTSQPFTVLLVGGQITGVLVGLLGIAALSIARLRERAAGVSLALLALKPQLFVLVLPVMLARLFIDGRPRIAASAAAVAAAMVVAPMAFVLAWPVEWLSGVGPSRIGIAGLLPTAWGFAADVLGNALWGVPLCAALLGTSALLARRVDPLALLALSLPLSLVITPHAWSYDFLVLAPSWAYVLARTDVRPRARIPLLASVVIVAAFLPWMLYAVAFARGLETLSVLVPALTALLVATTSRLTAVR